MKATLKSLLTLLGFIISHSIFAQAPVVSSFSPATGPAGTSVTITGSGFNTAAANDIVFFGATMAKVTAASATSLTVTVPVGATYQPISVLNGSTALIGYSARPFISTFTPAKGSITKDDFNPRVTITTSGWCQGIVIADLDGDGKPDLAMADLYNHTLSIFQNTSVSGSITNASFSSKITFATGNTPTGIAVGDLDGDGKPDLVVTNPIDNTLSVFRNTSTVGAINSSSFAAGAIITTPTDPENVVISDLDGDGKADLIVSHYQTNEVSVFRNTSVKGSITSSSFATHVDLQADSVTSIAVGDLDGDGKPDIVATIYQSHKVSVWRNTSTPGSITAGSFDPPVSLATGGSPTYAAIGDLDGDGKPELVVVSGIDTVSVFRNTSTAGSITTGSFAPRVDLIAAEGARSIAIADIDGDGKPDLSVLSYNSTVSIFRNISTTGAISPVSFSARADFFVGPYSYWFAIGDLDGDGRPDIAVPNSNNSVDANTVSILHNNPFFAPSVQATNLAFNFTLANSTKASWTNGNGQSRAVFIAQASAGNPLPVNGVTYTANSLITLGEQIGSSGWYCVYNGVDTSVTISGLSAGATYRVMAVEYNGAAGGENYLTTASTGNPANITTLQGGVVAIDSISRVTANPTTANTVQYKVTFATPLTGLTINNFSLTTTGSISAAAVTSVSGSGSVYTVTVNTGTGTGTVGLNLANATGLTPGIITTLPYAGPPYGVDHSVHAAPVILSFSPSNGVVGTSVTITGTGFAPTAANNIVFFGATMATVTAASLTSLTVTVPVGATYSPITVLNGKVGLIGYSREPFLTTFTPNKGDITTADFLPPVNFKTGNNCYGMAVADLDGDGKPDLVIANSADNTVSVLRNISVKGSITANSFAPKVDLATGRFPYSVAIGDLDGDGKPDIAVTNSNDNTISLLRNISTAGTITTASFAPRVDLVADSGAYNIVIGDLDGDGKSDIVVVTGTQSISILRNVSTVGSLTTNSFAAGVYIKASTWVDDYKYIAIGDLDGDGKPEIAVTAYQSNNVAVFHNNTTIGSINKTNSFAAPVYFPTNFLPMSVAIGDLDGDGKPDLVIGSGVISVLRNTSVYGSITSTSFAPRVDFLSIGGAQISISDLDGDGKPDIAAVDWYTNGKKLSVYRNTSTVGSINLSSLAAAVNFDVSQAGFDIAVADFDGDGRPDIAATLLGTDQGNNVAVLRNSPFYPPNTQAANIIFANTTTNSTTATWTNGNGSVRAVFIAAGSTGSPLPVNRTTYTANSVYTAGTQIGKSGWYCIYNGTGNTVNITGLSSGATYRTMVVEYNGSGGGEDYLTTIAAGNPANVTTVAGGPITINTIDLVTTSPTNANTIQYTVTFASSITGLAAGNFTLATTGTVSGANIATVSGSGSTYTVTVNTGTGEGTIGLNFVNATALVPGIITALPYVGPLCIIDRTAPAITISNPSVNSIISGSGQVTYTVSYADTYFNTSSLTASNITLNSNGSATGTATVTGSGTSYTVTISGITGSGSLGISIAAGTASDVAGNSAAAAGPSATFLIAPLLTNLTTSSGTLSPAFVDTTFAYTEIVNNTASPLTVTPVTTDPNATVTVNGGSASTPVNLIVGLNNITITVSTLDNSSSTTYTLGVVRAAPVATGLPPDIAYGNGKLVIVGTLPFSVNPTNKGGPVPKTNYGQVTTFAGSPAETAGYLDTVGTAALFNFPQQAVMDVAGNIFLAGGYNNSIRMITPAGLVTTFAGSPTGAPGLSDGTGTAALFNYPDGIAVDNAGNFFVSDYVGNAIRKITPTGVVTTFYSSSATFGPGGLCFDNSGNLIVTAQDASQIIRITPSGVASVLAGSTTGYANGAASSAQFDIPEDVKTDASGNIYVADYANNAIRRISPSGVVTTFSGSDVVNNNPGYANGKGTSAIFNYPTGIAIGPGGVIYVADLYNNDIRQIMPDSTVSLVAGSAAQAPGDSDGIGAAAGFTQPDYMFIDGTGTAYVSELAGNRVRKMVLTGYQLKGTLPDGMAFDPTTGLINGSVSAPFTTQTDTITAYNAFGYSSKVVTISYKQFSTIATLIKLVPNTGTLTPVFASATNNYTEAVPNTTTGITLTPTTTDTTATVTINGTPVASGTASGSIPLVVGQNTITTVVTAQDGVTTDTYAVVVTRAPSAVATLNNLTVSQGTLTPVFATETTAYTDSIANTVTSITVTPTTTDSAATVTVNGAVVNSGTASGDIPLLPGDNTITVVVTAQDGTIDTYIVTVYRGNQLSNLSATNVITPNGDGKNDYWVIKDIQLYPQNNVIVFDKAGRTVYSKHGYNNEWDGSFNGAPLVEGTYYYAVDLGPGLPKFKGFISIVRN